MSMEGCHRAHQRQASIIEATRHERKSVLRAPEILQLAQALTVSFFLKLEENSYSKYHQARHGIQCKEHSHTGLE